MSELTRRSLLKVGALTPLLTLFGKLDPAPAEVILATEADLRVIEKEVAAPAPELGMSTDPLWLSVRVMRGDKQVRAYQTSVYAGVEYRSSRMRAEVDSMTTMDGGRRYRLTGFKFEPRFEVFDVGRAKSGGIYVPE